MTLKAESIKTITMVTNNESDLVFTYKAMSDSEVKTMTVFKQNIIGYSLMQELPF
jgi:hypothetical protein